MEEKFTKVMLGEIDYLTDMVTGIMTKERDDKDNERDFKDIHCKRLHYIEGRESEIESIINEMRDSIEQIHRIVLWDMLTDLRDYISIAQTLIGDRKMRDDINKTL